MNTKPPLIISVEVVSVNQKERSTVHGSGGGGFTYKGTGFTVPVNVQTTHESRLEVWVKWPDGREDRLDFSGVDLLVREGHKLALLMSGNQIWAAKNFSTGVTTTFARAEHLVERRKRFGLRWVISRYFMIYFVSVLIVGVFLTLVGQGESSLLIDCIGFLSGIVFAGCLVFAVHFSRKSKKKWNLEMTEAHRLLVDGLVTLESAKLEFSNCRAAMANGE